MPSVPGGPYVIINIDIHKISSQLTGTPAGPSSPGIPFTPIVPGKPGSPLSPCNV